MKTKQLIVVAYCLLALPLMSIAADATKVDAENSIQTAMQLWENTRLAGHEWTTIRPLIAQAKQALLTNDFSTATAFAQKASTQSELAITQAEHEKTNWINNVLK